MSRDALRALADAAEAGEWIAAGDGSDTWLLIFDAGLQPHHGLIYEAWCRNSLDAAKALHEAVLPGWAVTLRQYPTISHVSMHRMDDEFCSEVHNFEGPPARAWLLAILRALAEQEDRDTAAPCPVCREGGE